MNREILIGLSIGCILILAAVGVLISTSAKKLQVISITPTEHQNTDSLQPLIVQFNRPLDPKTADRFSLTPNVNGKTSVNGDTLRFTPADAYDIGTTYTATIKAPQAQNGVKGQDVSFRFTPVEVHMNELPQSFLSKLPYQTNHYKIEYTTNPNNSVNLYITLQPNLSDPSQIPQYKAVLNQHKQEALDYIKQQGGDITKLNFFIYPDPSAYENQH